MNILRSELRKLLSIRMLWAVAGSAVALTALNAGILIALSGSPGALVPDLGTPEGLRTLYGVAGQSSVFALILGILSITAEYRHQTITATMLATPHRGRVLAAKMAASGALSLVVAVMAFATLLIAVGIGVAARGIGPIDAGELGTSLGGLLLGFGVYAVLGVAVGALVRNQIAALVGALVWVFIVESLIVAFWPDVGKWLPGGALNGVLQQQSFTAESYLSVWPAAALLLGYAAVLGGVALRTTMRRDIA